MTKSQKQNHHTDGASDIRLVDLGEMATNMSSLYYCDAPDRPIGWLLVLPSWWLSKAQDLAQAAIDDAILIGAIVMRAQAYHQ